MNLIILLVGLLFNCFVTSETKAKVVLSEEGYGEYYISSTTHLSDDEIISLPIIANYEYLIICKNGDESEPSFYIDGDWCGDDHIKITPKTSYFIDIEVKDVECTTLLIAIK